MTDIHKPDKVLPDGRGLWIMPLTYGRARIGIGRIGSVVFDDTY